MFTFRCGSRKQPAIESQSGRRAPRLLAASILLAVFSLPAFATVSWYHPTIFFPEQFQWERIVSGTPERRLENGWLIETVEEGERDFYRRDIGYSSWVGRFFIEWRAVTDYPEWLIERVPAVVVAGGTAGSIYHVVMTESAAVLTFFYAPRVVVPISSGVHTYRIEVYDDEYLWYIDGVVVDSGVPHGPYPDPNAEVVWGVEHFYEGVPTATTAFDYLRFGEIPEDASGNFNSDFGPGWVPEVKLDDYRFAHECMTNDGPDLYGGPDENAGPGCRFTDFDFDDDVDLFDFAEFQNVFTGNLG